MKIRIIPTVYVAVGIPGSGKSFWWENAVTKKYLPEDQSKRIHADIIRYDLFGDVNDYGKENLTTKIALTNLQSFLSYEIPIVYYDDLNLNKHHRVKLNKICKKVNYQTTAIVFDTPLEVCLERLEQGKVKKIPLETLQRYSKILSDNPVNYGEGWDDILVVK